MLGDARTYPRAMSRARRPPHSPLSLLSPASYIDMSRRGRLAKAFSGAQLAPCAAAADPSPREASAPPLLLSPSPPIAGSSCSWLDGRAQSTSRAASGDASSAAARAALPAPPRNHKRRTPAEVAAGEPARVSIGGAGVSSGGASGAASAAAGAKRPRPDDDAEAADLDEDRGGVAGGANTAAEPASDDNAAAPASFAAGDEPRRTKRPRPQG